jgi:P pilus assembly chaperone PapD
MINFRNLLKTATTVAVFSLGVFTSNIATAAANLGVSPTELRLPANQLTSSFLVKNQGNQPVSLSAQIMEWSQDDDNEYKLATTTELVVSPTLFYILPGQQQTVRVGRLQKISPPNLEKTFRLVLTEIPSIQKAEISAVSTVLKITLPIVVPPIAPDRKALTIEAIVEKRQNLIIKMANPGNTLQKLTGFYIKQNGEQKGQKKVNRYLLTGSHYKFIWENALQGLEPNKEAVLEVELNGRRRQTITVFLSSGIDIIPTINP